LADCFKYNSTYRFPFTPSGAAQDTLRKIGFSVPLERKGKHVEVSVRPVPAPANSGKAKKADVAAPAAASAEPPKPLVEPSAFNRAVTQTEVDVAMALDDVAAELQLGGTWN
jgi:hypothetical protein